LVRRASGSIPIRVRTKVRLEDGFKDELQRPLHHTVANARNLQPPDFASVLRDVHGAMRLRLLGPGQQISLDVRQKPFDAPRLNVGKRLPIKTWRPTIAFRLVVGFCQGVALGYMAKEPPAPMRLVRLRLPVYPPS
jgi:hypothetical protein